MTSHPSFQIAFDCARIRTAFFSSLACAFTFAFPANTRANVYATDVRINGGTTNATIAYGGNATISYRLNDDATAGVTLAVKSGNTTVRAISVVYPNPGTLRGTNSIVWNGKDNSSNSVPGGAYSFHVTAAANGYGDWQLISRNTDEGNYAVTPTGIAVNRNTNSPYYGRVFVANAASNEFSVALPGDNVGLLKANADGSPADEGPFSDGGWAWSGNTNSPWKIETSADDYVYVSDRSSNGLVLRFDQTLSAASRKLVLRSDNWPNAGAAKLSGPAIVGSGTNTQVWMADTNASGSVGLRRYLVTADGTLATNDTGVTFVQVGGNSQLDGAPFDVALDRSNRIYTIHQTDTSGDPTYRVFRFPATGGTNADWRIGSGDDNLRGAFGIAVDSTATYVAAAFNGSGTGPFRTGAGVRIFSAANGSDVTTLTPDSSHDHTDATWDNVGNVYVLDNYDDVWRAYSPPGSNAATTVALATVQVTAPPAQPVLSAPVFAAGQFQFTLTGESNVTYVILVSTNLQNWASNATSTSASAVRSITVAAPYTRSYYRAVVSP